MSNLRTGDETAGRVKRKFRAVATRSVKQQRASCERQLQATDRGCRRQTKKMNADRNVLSSNGDHQKVRAHPCPVRCGVRRALCALEKGHREPALPSCHRSKVKTDSSVRKTSSRNGDYQKVRTRPCAVCCRLCCAHARERKDEGFMGKNAAGAAAAA